MLCGRNAECPRDYPALSMCGMDTAEGLCMYRSPACKEMSTIFFGLTQSAQHAPAERGHHVGYHNLMGGRPVVADAGHNSPHRRPAPNSGHTYAHRGCSWARLVALEQHTAAAVESSCVARHIQVVPHRLDRHSLLPGTGPSTAVDTAGHTDSGRRKFADSVVFARKNAAGPGAGHKHCCCTLPGCLLQVPMARQLR